MSLLLCAMSCGRIWYELLDLELDSQGEGTGSGVDIGSTVTETETETDCAGGKLDPATNLCWQDPSYGDMTWYRASGTYDASYNPDTEDYCGDLEHGGHSDWRLPDIDELISLLRGCQNGIATGDLSTSLCEMTPADCAATDSCGNRTNCNLCSSGSGPASGCYWDPALGGGTCLRYWSSSSIASNSYGAWFVYFDYGFVGLDDKGSVSRVRCVRSGP